MAKWRLWWCLYRAHRLWLKVDGTTWCYDCGRLVG